MTDRLAEIAARHANVPQDTLPLDFPDAMTGAKDTRRSDKSVAQAVCPWHAVRGDDQTTGLIRTSKGLVFREHTHHVGKTTVRCPGSGQAPEEMEDA